MKLSLYLFSPSGSLETNVIYSLYEREVHGN